MHCTSAAHCRYVGWIKYTTVCDWRKSHISTPTEGAQGSDRATW